MAHISADSHIHNQFTFFSLSLSRYRRGYEIQYLKKLNKVSQIAYEEKPQRELHL